MYSLEPHQAFRKTSIIKSNLLSATKVDIDSLVKCLQTDKNQHRSLQKQKHSSNKETVKNRLSRAYFPNKYKIVEPALRIKFNQNQQKQILIPSEVQVQAHIVNVSFGVNKRKKPKKQHIEKLPLSLGRPKTSGNVKRPSVLEQWSQIKQMPLKSSQNRYRQKSYSPTKIKVQCIQFTNEQIVTLNPTLHMINKSNQISNRVSNRNQEEQEQIVDRQLYNKTFNILARKSVPLNSKATNLKKQFFYKRKFMLKKDPFTFSLEGKRNTSENKIEMYRDFLWKINFSCGLYVDAELELKKPFKVFVGGGNNSVLVKSLMKRRFWWVIVDKLTDDVNFVWTQLKNQNIYKLQIQAASKNQKDIDKLIDYSKSVTVSTIQYKKHMSSKDDQLSFNLKNKNSNIFKGEDLQLWNQHYIKNFKTQNMIDNRTYTRRIPLMKKKSIHSIQKSDKLIIHNHFRTNSYIGNKKAMFYNMKLYYNIKKKDVFANIPITFHIIKGINDPEFKKFNQIYSTFQKQKSKKGSNKNIWIIKPGEFTNRGKGISVCNSLEEILSRLNGKEKNADGSTRTFILQKYIQRPFLYFKRKFDIRHYMMITCINKKIKGYWYQQGYIRTTSTQFNLKNHKNNYIHLTNDAIQKNSQDYGKFQKGNKLSYQEFQKYLDSQFEDQGLNFSQMILPEMKRIANDAIKSTYSLLDGERLQHNFEIFGLDFMIDQNFKTYLIQINTNPCLELASPLLAKLIPSMLSNALMIGLDPLFPPPYNWPSHKKYQLMENPMETNKFELIFDENCDGPELVSLYSNIKKIDERMGNIDDEEEEYPEEQGQWNEEMG